jgi:hypothetical protein
VRDDYDLAPLASIAEVRHELLENRIWIEVLLGLVDNERALVVHVDGKIEQQENDAARSRRELFDRKRRCIRCRNDP